MKNQLKESVKLSFTKTAVMIKLIEYKNLTFIQREIN